MDISMPGINGIDATRIIMAEMPEVRVIGLSMHEDVEMRCKMQEAGAEACCHKGGPVAELVEVIRAVT
jgi:DNA-binding NarL/FixJ family response regulator